MKVLMLAVLASVLSACTSGNPQYGRHLPATEQEFDAMGAAMADLDADRLPYRRLDDLVGTWRIEGSYQPWDDAPPQQVEPVCTVQWIVDRRCLELRYRYLVPGGPIEDLVLIRWNPLAEHYGIQLYSSGWPIPNGGTGRWDDESGTLDFQLETVNPASRETIRTLYRLESLSADGHTWKQYRSTADGTLVPFLTMNASRVRSSDP